MSATTESTESFRVGKLPTEDLINLVEVKDPRVIAYAEGVANATDSLVISTSINVLSGPDAVIDGLERARENAQKMLSQIEDGSFAEELRRAEDDREQRKQQLEELGSSLEDMAKQLAAELGIELDESGLPVESDTTGPAPEGEQVWPDEYGRTFRFDTAQDFEDANQSLAGAPNPAEAIGARPTALVEFVGGAVQGAQSLGLTPEDFGTWMIAVGYALGGGQITDPQEQYAAIDKARADFENSQGDTPEEVAA